MNRRIFRAAIATALTLVAALLISCRGTQQTANTAQTANASPSPATITTNSGGATVTYQVQESTGGTSPASGGAAAPTDRIKFSLTPEEVEPGQPTMLNWYVPGCEDIRVNGEAPFPERKPDGSSVNTTLPHGSAVSTPPDRFAHGSSISGDVVTYRLTCTMKGTGKPISYEAKLKLKPRPDRGGQR